jgi:hypothetical protein
MTPRNIARTKCSRKAGTWTLVAHKKCFYVEPLTRSCVAPLGDGTPIINPPQSAILGMHSIVKRAVVVDGQIVIRPMMNVVGLVSTQIGWGGQTGIWTFLE